MGSLSGKDSGVHSFSISEGFPPSFPQGGRREEVRGEGSVRAPGKQRGKGEEIFFFIFFCSGLIQKLRT